MTSFAGTVCSYKVIDLDDNTIITPISGAVELTRYIGLRKSGASIFFEYKGIPHTIGLSQGDREATVNGHYISLNSYSQIPGTRSDRINDSTIYLSATDFETDGDSLNDNMYPYLVLSCEQ